MKALRMLLWMSWYPVRVACYVVPIGGLTVFMCLAAALDRTIWKRHTESAWAAWERLTESW